MAFAMFSDIDAEITATAEPSLSTTTMQNGPDNALARNETSTGPSSTTTFDSIVEEALPIIRQNNISPPPPQTPPPLQPPPRDEDSATHDNITETNDILPMREAAAQRRRLFARQDDNVGDIVSEQNSRLSSSEHPVIFGNIGDVSTPTPPPPPPPRIPPTPPPHQQHDDDSYDDIIVDDEMDSGDVHRSIEDHVNFFSFQNTCDLLSELTNTPNVDVQNYVRPLNGTERNNLSLLISAYVNEVESANARSTGLLERVAAIGADVAETIESVSSDNMQIKDTRLYKTLLEMKRNSGVRRRRRNHEVWNRLKRMSPRALDRIATATCSSRLTTREGLLNMGQAALTDIVTKLISHVFTKRRVPVRVAVSPTTRPPPPPPPHISPATSASEGDAVSSDVVKATTDEPTTSPTISSPPLPMPTKTSSPPTTAAARFGAKLSSIKKK